MITFWNHMTKGSTIQATLPILLHGKTSSWCFMENLSCQAMVDLLCTQDAGNTWTDLTGNLNLSSPHYLYHLAISGSRLFAGINAGGLWYRDNIVTGQNILENERGDISLRLFPNPATGSDITVATDGKFLPLRPSLPFLLQHHFLYIHG